MEAETPAVLEPEIAAMVALYPIEGGMMSIYFDKVEDARWLVSQCVSAWDEASKGHNPKPIEFANAFGEVVVNVSGYACACLSTLEMDKNLSRATERHNMKKESFLGKPVGFS